MSVHRSLSLKGGGRRHRNVLSRKERIAKLEDEGRWSEDDSIFGLPKVRSIKPTAGKKAAKKKEAEVEGAEVAEGAAVEGVPAETAAEGAASGGKGEGRPASEPAAPGGKGKRGSGKGEKK